MQDVAFVTCGDWDCKHIKTQCGICEVPFPRAFAQWINISGHTRKPMVESSEA